MPGEPDSSGAPAIDILVEAGPWPAKAKLRAIATRAITAAVAAAKPRLAEGAELSLVFTDDDHIRELNLEHRDKDKPTNVLSFPSPPAQRGTFGPLLGDVVLSAETVTREADEEAISLEDHLIHLIVHGFLHLLGYDHEDDSEAVAMEKLETGILAGLGIADPYAGGPR